MIFLVSLVYAELLAPTANGKVVAKVGAGRTAGSLLVEVVVPVPVPSVAEPVLRAREGARALQALAEGGAAASARLGKAPTGTGACRADAGACPVTVMSGYPCRVDRARSDSFSFGRDITALGSDRSGQVLSTRDYFGCDKPDGGAYAGEFHGSFAALRAALDYSWHANYCPQRQQVQDSVVRALAQQVESRRQPWSVFLAGAMGTGKTFVRQFLARGGVKPFEGFATVDMDEIREKLPEWDGFIRAQTEHPDECAGTAAERTQSEAGYVQELLVGRYLELGASFLGDGSLANADWYTQEFKRLRSADLGPRRAAWAQRAMGADKSELRDVKPRKIAIIYVSNPDFATIQENAQSRAKETGRAVSLKDLKRSFDSVPASMEVLRKHADVFMEIENRGAPHVPTLKAHEVRNCDASGDCDEVTAELSLGGGFYEQATLQNPDHWVPFAMAPILASG